MSRFIDVPIFAGLNTQADKEDIGLLGCISTKNFEVDKPGIIYKRQGTKRVTTAPSARTFTQLIKWVNPKTGTAYWFAYDSTNKTIYRYDSNWGNEKSIKTLANATDIKIINFADYLRFANGQGDKAGIYQYLNRNYFWNSAIKTFTGFDYDDVTPHNGDQDISFGTPTYDTASNGTYGTGVTVYYKIVPLFDGNQEAPLSDEYWSATPSADKWVASTAYSLNDQVVPTTSNGYIYRVTVAGTSGGSQPTWPTVVGDTVVDGGVTWICGLATIISPITFNMIATKWNERITAYKIYRSTSGWGGTYYHVLTVNTLDNNDPNLIYQAGLNVGNVLYVSDANWTTNVYQNKYVFINGVMYQISSNSTDILVLPSQLEEGRNLWDEKWGIITSNLFNANCGSDFEINNFTDWTLSGSYTVFEIVSQKYSGSYGAKIEGDNSWSIAQLDDITGINGGTTYRFSVALHAGDSLRIIIEVSDDVQGGWTDLITQWNDSWGSFEADYTTGEGATLIRIRIHRLSITGGGHAYVDNLYFGVKEDGDSSYGYAGRNTVISDSLSLGNKDSHLNWRVLVGTNTDGNNHASDPDIRRVINNVKKAVKVDSDFSSSARGNNQKMYLNRSYLWQKSGSGDVALTIYDTNFLDGSKHPTLNIIIAVNYKYAQYIDGRLYIAGVRLDPDGEAEDHETWIMFSELLQPDVIPVTNYIPITDTQGGKITGLGEILGDLVVFMERGVYRLRIPSSDPTSWELIEANEDIGCKADNSITKVEGSIFFPAEDYLYMITPNFNFVRVNNDIRDTYQSMNDITTRLLYDVKKGRLLCRFGNDKNNIYALDLIALFNERKEFWNMMNFENDVELFAIDENLKPFYVYEN